VLIVKDDVFIIDFEGEPTKPTADRRRKAPAARDIAGLVRSIDYSTTSAFDRGPQSSPEERERLFRALGQWRAGVVEAFLAAYHDVLADASLWPVDAATSRRLLDFFLVEKVFYEIEYELAHRPAWLHVPLEGALRMLSKSGSESTAQ
jgi:maltose alpha-D-glucosyltransferase/alpha-amylase